MGKRIEKANLISGLNERFKRAKAIIITDFKGLNVDALNSLRKELREKGMEYKVAKNTLIRLALKETPLEHIKGEIKGCNALAFCYNDPVILAKTLIDFKKKNEVFGIKWGILSGRLLKADEIEELSRLPNREVLLSQLLGTMYAVPAGIVGLFHNILLKLLYVLNEIKKTKEKED